MNSPPQNPPQRSVAASSDRPAGSATPRFSLERLSSAFAKLMGATSHGAGAAATPQVAVVADDASIDDAGLLVTPRMIVEGMLFVGDAAGKPLTARQIASHIRDVTPAEVENIVAELNAVYQQDGAAYEIVPESGGYRLQLREDLNRLRDRFRGRVRAARLTPQALEVLSIVAYHQGVTGDEINRMRSSQSYPILSQLVRRQLVRVERSKEPPRTARYFTTARFNQVFGVASHAELPRIEELADS